MNIPRSLEELREAIPSQTTALLAGLLALGNGFNARMAEAATPPQALEEFPIEQLDTDAVGGMDFPTWGLELKEIPNETLWRLQQAENELKKYGFKEGKYFAVDAEHQVFAIMESYGDGQPSRLLGAWPTSTAKNGLGTENGSGKTPTGVFELKTVDGRGGNIGVIRAQNGYGQTVADLDTGGGRKPTMTTRFILMHGLDPETANTAERDIGLHGTNYEARLGTADSKGCIRLDNDTIILVSAIMRGNDDHKDSALSRDFLVVIDEKAAPYAKIPSTHATGIHKIPSADDESPWSDHPGWE